MAKTLEERQISALGKHARLADVERALADSMGANASAETILALQEKLAAMKRRTGLTHREFSGLRSNRRAEMHQGQKEYQAGLDGAMEAHERFTRSIPPI